MIAPITVRILAYGQKSNISKIVTAAEDLLRDEYDEPPAGSVEEADPAEVAGEIQAALWDQDFALLKKSKSHRGVRIALPEVNERVTVEFLHELKIAKTCVFFAQWYSANRDETQQLLVLRGEPWSEAREGQG